MLRFATLLILGMLNVSIARPPVAVNRQLANIVGEADGRGSVLNYGPKLGLSTAQVQQIRSAVGYIRCPAGRSGNPSLGTAFLIREDVVVTVAHALFDVNERDSSQPLPRAPHSECYYQSQGDSVDKYPIRPETLIVGSLTPEKDAQSQFGDFAVVRLARPVQGAQPLPVILHPFSIEEDGEFFPVVAYRAAEYRLEGENLNEPLIQRCSVRAIVEARDPYSPDKIFSDCDNTLGGSGGPNLARRRNGQLAVFAMFYGGGLDKNNFKPFKFSHDPGEMSFSASLKVSGSFAQAISQALNRR